MSFFDNARPFGRRMVAFVTSVAAVVAVAAPLRAEDKEPVRIGSVALMSSAYTQQGIRGMDLAVKEINAAGGVLGGHPIELIKYDDQNKPEEAAAAAERLISRDKAKVVLGSLTTTATAALSSVAKRRNAVLIGWSAKSESLREGGTPLQFFLNSTVSQDTAQYSDFIISLGLKRVAIVAEQSDYGQSAINSITALWKGNPKAPEIVAVERFDPRDTDFSPILTKVKGTQPDALYIAPGGAVETFANILKQRRQLGVQGLVLPAPGAMTGSLIGLAGEATDGLVFGDFYSNGSELPQSVDFVQRFQKEYGYAPEKMELLGYEAVQAAAKGIDTAGPDASAKDIATAISGVEMESARGKWRFDRLGASYQAPAGFALLTVKDGKITGYKP